MDKMIHNGPSSICLFGDIKRSTLHFIENLSMKSPQDTSNQIRILNRSFFLSNEHFRLTFVEDISEDQSKRFFDKWDITLIKIMRENLP